MLNILRKKGVAKKIIWFIAIIIIISFGFLGTAYLVTNSGVPTYAGKIFGKTISINDFSNIYQQTRILAILRYGENFRNLEQYLNLEAETWDRLILLHEAKKRRIKISDENVITAIKEYQFFQRDGQFDSLLYNDILQYVFRVPARVFEETVRDMLKITKVYEEETTGVTASDEDIQKAYAEKHEKVQVDYILLKPDQFLTDVSVADAEAQEYYNANKLDFMEQESINVAYIEIPFPDLKDKDEEATNILKKETENKAYDIYQELLSNPSIEAAAKQFNQTVRYSGFFSREQPNLALGWSFEVLNNIFEKSLNDILEPFGTASGYHILQLKEMKEAFVPEYAAIKDKVNQSITITKAGALAHTRASTMIDSINANKDFAAAANSLNYEISQTPIFSRGDYLPKVGISNEFQEAAFGLTSEAPTSGVVEIPQGYCVLHLTQKIPFNQELFLKEKEAFAETLNAQKKEERFTEFLNKKRIEANFEENLSRLRAEQQPAQP